MDRSLLLLHTAQATHQRDINGNLAPELPTTLKDRDR
jgi:hypothetical protein